MKRVLKSRAGIACMVAAGLLLLGLLAFGGYEYWRYQQPKFHDLTIELGTDSVSIRDFMTEYARPQKVAFVTDPAAVDLNQTGQIPLTLRHGRAEETVVLTIQDTTAPAAQFAQRCVVLANQPIPDAAELVTEVTELSEYKVYYQTEPAFPADYQDEMVTIVVEDASGNSIRGAVQDGVPLDAGKLYLGAGAEPDP